ncbi:MAG TPA: phosphatase PAP2 family protein [Bryobacteraceae bacterium]|nr:phosphatase PAP2 family protein [Bryobacteraceae bacterium]
MSLAHSKSASPILTAGGSKGGFASRLWITAAAAASLAVLMLSLPLGAAGFLTEAFAGAALMYLYSWKSIRDWIAAAAAAAAFGAIYEVSHAAVGYLSGWDFAFPAALYVLGGLLVLFYRATGPSAAEREKLLEIIPNTALVPGLCLASFLAVWLDIRLTPRTFDPSLYRFDQALGFAPGFALARFYWTHPALRLAAGLVYNSLPIHMCWMCAVWLRRAPRRVPDVRVVFAVLGVVGFLAYQLCPAAGPVYLIGNAFPYHAPATPSALSTMAIPDAPRNAMPSLHVATCLLIFYNVWRQAIPVRIYAALWVVLTAVATLGTGEHYLIDLAMAIPLSIAVQLACTDPRRNARLAAVWIAALAAWLLALRSGFALRLHDPIPAWSAVALTFVAPAAAWKLQLRQDRFACSARPASLPRRPAVSFESNNAG